jgi:hypothetical protein
MIALLMYVFHLIHATTLFLKGQNSGFFVLYMIEVVKCLLAQARCLLALVRSLLVLVRSLLVLVVLMVELVL